MIRAGNGSGFPTRLLWIRWFQDKVVLIDVSARKLRGWQTPSVYRIREDYVPFHIRSLYIYRKGYFKNKIVLIMAVFIVKKPCHNIQQESQSCLKIHPIWKLNAFTCFVAFSWGERFLEVGACCVQLVFWKTWFGTLIFYLRSCTLVLAMSDCLFTYLNKIVSFQKCTWSPICPWKLFSPTYVDCCI